MSEERKVETPIVKKKANPRVKFTKISGIKSGFVVVRAISSKYRFREVPVEFFDGEFKLDSKVTEIDEVVFSKFKKPSFYKGE